MGSRTVRSRIKVYVAGVVMLVAAIAAAGFARGGAEASSVAAVDAVSIGAESVHVVSLGTVQSGPVISGSLQPERKATVRAELAGAVLATSVEVGQRVRAGDLLGRIEDAAIGDARVSAQSAVRAAEAAADVARRQVDRVEALAAEGAVAERAVEDARAAALAAERQLADARTALAQADKLLGKTTLRAPIAGVVAERAVSAGDIVQPGMALFTVVDPASMELEASVPSEQLVHVRIGAAVEFRVNGYAQPFTGRVERISPLADPVTRQVRIFVSIPNRGNRLVGGLFAEGRIASRESAGMIAPATALQPVTGRADVAEVLRVRGGAVERVEVTVGLRDDRAEQVELLGGVAEGDTLLIGAARTITPGTPVQVRRSVAAQD